MSTSLAYADPRQTFDWEELLLFIEERRVIPIVGSELLTLSLDGKEVLLEAYLASRLAETLDLPAQQLPQGFGLNEVAVLYEEQRGNRKKIYSKIKSILEERPLPVPVPLRKLAAITGFNLFISTTFDFLLADALNEARFYGQKQTLRLAYSTHAQLQDLPCGLLQLEKPCVFQIFGQANSSTDYAVTDEDLLEFLHILQSDAKQPKQLFDELRDNHLLFLGCGFPDWLARFFIRTLTNERLVNYRESSEFFVDRFARQEPALTHFLQHYQAEVFLPGDPIEFIDTLYDRWTTRLAVKPPGGGLAADEEKMAPGSIFLSYASEDLEAAENMKEALEAAGLDVWFDKRRLESGDAWDSKIRKNIFGCSLFLPFVSKSSCQRVEGYFRKEWWWAIERAPEFSEDFPFIQPIVIGDAPSGSAGVPDYFWTRQCSRFPEGKPDPEFVMRARNAIRRLRAL